MTLNIAVIGAGIGGLAAAAGLAQDGYTVTLYDQMKTPQPIGSGIVVQPTGQHVLDQLGAWDTIKPQGALISRIFGYDAHTKKTSINVHYSKTNGLGLNRGALFQGLWDCALKAGVLIEANRFVTDVTGTSVHHNKGRDTGYDLIVDASGANSLLSPMKAKPLGYGALWTCVPWNDTLPNTQLSQVYLKAQKMMGILPIGKLPHTSQNLAAVFWSIKPQDYQSWLDKGIEAWKEEATTLWPEFGAYLHTITAQSMTLARYTHGTLKNPIQGRLLHIGDAAHRTSPQLGQGANMALIDAHALRRSLQRHPHHLNEALRCYATARKWHIRGYQLMSRLFTPQYQSDSTIQPWLRDTLLYPLSTVPPIPAILRHMVEGTMLPPYASLD